MNRSRKIFSLDTPLNLEQHKWLLISPDSDVCNSVFYIQKKRNKKVSYFIESYWTDLVTIK